MKKLLLSFITATLLSSIPCSSVIAQELPAQKETLATIVKVNDYFMKKYADYTLPSFFGRVRPSNIWTRGVYYEGLMALYSIYPREDYYSYTYDWANFTNGECVTETRPAMRMINAAGKFILTYTTCVLPTRT